MSASIEIGRHRIGRGHPCFVIAEVGVNHNGDTALAHELIDVAVMSGADAVKFQTFTPELLAAPRAPQADYQRQRAVAGDQLEMLARLTLSESALIELKAHSDASDITFLSSPFDEGAVALLQRVGVPAFKVPSGELTNAHLLHTIAETDLPIIVSTGMASLEEIDQALEVLGPARQRIALLHCVSSYPADPRDCNLHAIETMRTRYGTPVGWSDHTEGIAVAIAAVALGADIVEKHITIDRGMKGPDHAASIEPNELRAMIDGIRQAEAALGDGVKRPVDAEAAIAAVARKSLHWSRALAAGEPVRPDDLIALRPGTGIPASRMDDFVGRPVAAPTVAGTLVRVEDFTPAPVGSTI